MKFLFLFFLIKILTSCGYPDIDTVPDFKDVTLTDQEIYDYCASTNDSKINLEKCVNDYKSE